MTVLERPLTSRLAVVARPDYLEALRTLVKLGKATCTQLARLFHWKEPRAWRCLEALRHAGLVERRGSKAWVWYMPCLAEIRALFETAAAYICQNGETPGSIL